MNASIVIASASVICSALAFFLTIYHAQLARKHQRLLGKPHCHFMAFYQEHDNRKAGLYLHNVGPVAVVRKWKFWFNREFLGEDFEGMQEAVNKMGGKIVRGTFLQPGDCFPPQTLERIIWLAGESPDTQIPQSVKGLFENRLRLLEAELTIESIYEEKTVVSYRITLSGKADSLSSPDQIDFLMGERHGRIAD